MNRNCYIAYYDKGLKKWLFHGLNDAYYSDFQSAVQFSKPEAKKQLHKEKIAPNRDKTRKLKILRIPIYEEV